MTQHINYLKSNPEISNVLAEGFAQIYHLKPEFPVTFLSEFLHNYSLLKQKKKSLGDYLNNIKELGEEINKNEQIKRKQKQRSQDKLANQKDREEAFKYRIKQAPHHEQFLNPYCQWIQKEKNLTGVYIGQLQNQWKKINLDVQDSQEVHIDLEAPKVIKFKAASYSHNTLIIGKSLPLESVVGRLLTEKAEEGGGEGEEGQEKPKAKGQVYIPFVQENKDLVFFKYPKLGSFYAVSMKVKSYLHQKIYDANIVKTEAFKKIKEQFDKEHEERENKFRALYDQKSNSGVDEKELQEMQKNYEKEEENFPAPKQQEFEYVLRQFVVCFDTLGLDREIDEADRQYLKSYVEFLRNTWQQEQCKLLQKDIDSQLKVIAQNIENPQMDHFNKLIEEQDKELPSHEEVQKVKANEKLAQLQINTLRVQKIVEYLEQQKNLNLLQNLLERRIIKYAEIMKVFFYFAGYTKEEVCFRGSNVINWFKARSLLTKEGILTKIKQFVPRGGKINVLVKPFAKWQRILKNLQKFDLNNVASYSIILAFILRFLLTSGRVRIADQQARKNATKLENDARQQKIKEIQRKQVQKQQKLATLKADAEAKQQVFDEQSWLRTYEQQNPAIEVGEEVILQRYNDLQQAQEIKEQ